MTVPKLLNDTDTDTFIRYQIFSIPIPVLFSVPNFLDTGSETFFRYSILTIPVPRLFPVPNFNDTGSEIFSGTGTSHSGSCSIKSILATKMKTVSGPSHFYTHFRKGHNSEGKRNRTKYQNQNEGKYHERKEKFTVCHLVSTGCFFFHWYPPKKLKY